MATKLKLIVWALGCLFLLCGTSEARTSSLKADSTEFYGRVKAQNDSTLKAGVDGNLGLPRGLVGERYGIRYIGTPFRPAYHGWFQGLTTESIHPDSTSVRFMSLLDNFHNGRTDSTVYWFFSGIGLKDWIFPTKFELANLGGPHRPLKNIWVEDLHVANSTDIDLGDDVVMFPPYGVYYHNVAESAADSMDIFEGYELATDRNYVEMKSESGATGIQDYYCVIQWEAPPWFKSFQDSAIVIDAVTANTDTNETYIQLVVLGDGVQKYTPSKEASSVGATWFTTHVPLVNLVSVTAGDKVTLRIKFGSKAEQSVRTSRVEFRYVGR